MTNKNIAQAFDKIISARVRLLLNSPFFGNIATRLQVVDASEWVPTAGTDGKYLYLNVDFVNSLDRKELEFLIGHEVLHCVYDHFGRINGRDKQLWNIAADYAINLDLVDQKIGTIISRDDITPCYDIKYRDMSADQIYQLLADDKNSKQMVHNFDVHITGDGDGKGDPTGKTGPIPMSKSERAQLSDEIKQAVIEAVKASAGNCPKAVKRMVSDLIDSKVDWRTFLNASIQSCIKNDYSYVRPSRKSSGMSGNIIMPGHNYDDTVDVVFCIDTSGSISQTMLRDFLSEVKGIMEQFADFKLTGWCFDTATYKTHTYTPETINELDEFNIEGGGGTDFMANWEFMKDSDFVPNQLIVMTDGYPCGDWGDDTYCDTVFLIHGNTDIVAPFGVTCYYTE